MVLKVSAAGQSATTTAQRWALVYGYAGGPWTNNVEVSHLDLSLLDSTAVLELVFGRVAIQSDPGQGGYSSYFDAVGNNLTGGQNSGFHSTSNPFFEVLGQYYIQGGEALQLDFPTPIEAFKITQDYAFAYQVRLVGATSGTADGTYFLNVWFSEA